MAKLKKPGISMDALGILQPILGYRFRLMFGLNNHDLQHMSQQAVACKVDMVKRTLSITFDSALADANFDDQLQAFAGNHNARRVVQIQYLDGQHNVIKTDTFTSVKIDKCDYEANYANGNMIQYHVELNYNDREVNLIEIDQEKFIDNVREGVEQAMTDYLFEQYNDKLSIKLRKHLEQVLKMSGAYDYLVGDTHFNENDNSLKVDLCFQQNCGNEFIYMPIRMGKRGVDFKDIVDNPKNND